MKALLGPFLQMLAFAVVVIIIYGILKKYLFSKIKINKWIILAVTIVLILVFSFFAPFIIARIGSMAWTYITSGITIILFLWFIDLALPQKKRNIQNQQYPSGRKKEKYQQVIKPKAKPKRAKNLNSKK